MKRSEKVIGNNQIEIISGCVFSKGTLRISIRIDKLPTLITTNGQKDKCYVRTDEKVCYKYLCVSHDRIYLNNISSNKFIHLVLTSMMKYITQRIAHAYYILL